MAEQGATGTTECRSCESETSGKWHRNGNRRTPLTPTEDEAVKPNQGSA